MNAVLTIRRAGAKDVPAVTEITDAAYAKWVSVIDRKPLPMTVDYALAVQQHIIDVGELDGSVVALVEMINKGDHLMIENLAVAPEAQGQGFGKQLLNHAQSVAKSLSLPVIRLLTNAKFTSNIQFYSRNQYQIDQELPFKGGIVVHMSKTIDQLF